MSNPPVMKAPQPGAPQLQYMPPPQRIPGVPPGLEYLTQLDQLLIHQQIELFEVLTGIEMKNRYQIKNSLGQQCSENQTGYYSPVIRTKGLTSPPKDAEQHQLLPLFSTASEEQVEEIAEISVQAGVQFYKNIVYFAYETSDLCMRICCGPVRGFILHIVDNMQQEVMRVVRPFQCCAGCCWCADADCCGMTISVESPPGVPIGFVRQRSSGWNPHYDILDANKEPILKIRGPCWFCQCICYTEDIDFALKTKDDTQEIGKISKQWGGLGRECFTSADNFGLNFPKDLDVKVKATLIAATILIEFMLYEQKNNNN